MKKYHTNERTEAIIALIERETKQSFNIFVFTAKDCGKKIYRAVIKNVKTGSTYELEPAKTRAALNAQLEGIRNGLNSQRDYSRIKELHKARARDDENKRRAEKYSMLERRKYIRALLLREPSPMFYDTTAEEIRLYKTLISKAVKAGWLGREAVEVPINAEIWIANVQYACLLRNEGLI